MLLSEYGVGGGVEREDLNVNIDHMQFTREQNQIKNWW